MTVIALTVWLALEVLHVEQRHFKDTASCVEYGQEKVASLQIDPKTDHILFGACITSRAEQVRAL